MRESGHRKPSHVQLAVCAFGWDDQLRCLRSLVRAALQPNTSFNELSAVRLKQHCVPMKIEELPLPAGEPSDINGLCGVDAHSLERGTVSNRRDYELAIVLEADESTIEEMVDTRR